MKIRTECATCEHWARESFCTRISCGMPCVFGELPEPTLAERIATTVGFGTADAIPPVVRDTVADAWTPNAVPAAAVMGPSMAERIAAVVTANAVPPPAARDTQVGGNHYKTVAVQPWDVVDTWPLEQRIGYYRGGALKYIMRMGSKDQNAVEVAKGKHYLEKLLEVLK